MFPDQLRESRTRAKSKGGFMFLCACMCNPGFIIPVSCCCHCIRARDSHTSSTLATTQDYVFFFCISSVIHLSKSPPGQEYFWTNDSRVLEEEAVVPQWAFRSHFKLCTVTEGPLQGFSFFCSFIEDRMDRWMDGWASSLLWPRSRYIFHMEVRISAEC